MRAGSAPEAFAEIPRLPAPKAGSYAVVPQTPPDPAVARLMGDAPWDASLSGAAAGLALAGVAGGRMDAWVVREAAWRAGWPYPVSQVRAWRTDAGAAPPAAVTDWIAAQTAGVAVGLVRARADGADLWVGLSSQATADLGVIPRQLAVAATVTAPGVAGARWVAGDPDGGLTVGGPGAPLALPLNREGEWLLELRSDASVLARFPVYAGMAPPEVDLLALPTLPADDAGRTAALLDEIRAVYGRTAWRRDPTLDAAARSALNGDLPDLAAAAARLGFPDPATWRCSGPTVPACLDQAMWRPEDRAVFLSDRTLLGLAFTGGSAGVSMVGVASGE